MTEQEEEYTQYLIENNVMPRLLDVLKNMLDLNPLPEDPLMEILHAINCPLIPQEQMKALERKVSRAHDELRQLRRILIDLGREEDLYNSDTDENEYVGKIGAMGTGLMYARKEHYADCKSTTSSSRSPSPLPQQSTSKASIVIKEVNVKEEKPLHIKEDPDSSCRLLEQKA